MPKPTAFRERRTASQTIKRIETLGYLTRIRSEDDGRSVQFVLTDKARDILANDPLEYLVHAADSLPNSLQEHFSNALQRMVGQVAKERGKPAFGTCTSCRHLKCHNCSRDEQMPYECGLKKAPLILEELDRVCINFAPDKPVTIPSVS